MSAQIRVLENSYEYLRRRKAYREPRLTRAFRLSEGLAVVKGGNLKRLELSVDFARDPIGEEKWREYETQLLRLYQAFLKKARQFPIMLLPTHSEGRVGYLISVSLDSKDRFDLPEKLGLLFYPSSLQSALSPITFSADRGTVFQLQKRPFTDWITEKDMRLVLAYYGRICEEVLRDVEGRGLTVYCAVSEGASIVRRNDVQRQRLVTREADDIGRMIKEYQAYRFVPDVNPLDSAEITRVPIDLDRPDAMEWKVYSDFVNEFASWLEGKGFHPKLRLTGGSGAHVIIDMRVNKVVSSYTSPFPRELKFETWFWRVGEAGLIGAQTTDFVKMLGLAFGMHRRHRLGKAAPITLELHDVSQRYFHIFVDHTRAKQGMGVVSPGSIHHETGRVCLPVRKVPAELNLQSVVSCSLDPEAKVPQFEARYCSPWIQLVGENPQLLLEPQRPDPLSLMEETFEQYSWVPAKYVEMGSEAFLERYAW